MAIQPVASSNSNAANWNQVNNMIRQLSNEQVTKTFKQSGGNSVVQGKLPYGGYGTLIYDANNIPRIIIGTSPDDGRIGIWVSEEGQSVIDLLEA